MFLTLQGIVTNTILLALLLGAMWAYTSGLGAEVPYLELGLVIGAGVVFVVWLFYILDVRAGEIRVSFKDETFTIIAGLFVRAEIAEKSTVKFKNQTGLTANMGRLTPLSELAKWMEKRHINPGFLRALVVGSLTIKTDGSDNPTLDGLTDPAHLIVLIEERKKAHEKLKKEKEHKKEREERVEDTLTALLRALGREGKESLKS